METSIVDHFLFEGFVSEGEILNRITRTTCAGWEYECDQRHVETLIGQLGLTGSRYLSTPGVDEPSDQLTEDKADATLLDPETATRYRALSARCSYISVDRVDAQYCIKEPVVI